MSEAVSVSRFLEPATGGDIAATSWAAALRVHGRENFTALGIPDRRVEAWKYSDLDLALRQAQTVEEPARPPVPLPGAFVATFDNGVFDMENSNLPRTLLTPLRTVLADASSPYAEVIGRINSAEQKAHPIIGLNTAQMEEGFILHLPKGESLQSPLHIRFNWHGEEARAPEGRHLRFLIVLEEGASASIVETHAGAPALATIVTELRLAEGADLSHLRIEQLGAAARQSAVTLGEAAASAKYRGFYLSEGAQFCRHEALLELSGEEADVSIDGAFLLSGGGHCDNTTVITHAAPSTTSHQAFRGALAGRAKGAYQGCIKVRPEAQQTDARQMSRALLLSPEAQIATKPELEIFADDVKCGHGATAGEIDADALFFLRARGIPEAQARAMLIEAFLGEALDAIKIESLRDLASDIVKDWLELHASAVSHA